MPPNEAGGLFALKLTDGQPLWHTAAPKLECNTGRGYAGTVGAGVGDSRRRSRTVDGHMLRVRPRMDRFSGTSTPSARRP
jgi:outer membrane protein assembly factor BamB